MIGTLWKHTPKGIKRGLHADRVYAVVGIEPVDDGSAKPKDHLIAWKCDILPSGKLRHPAFAEPIDIDDPRIFIKAGTNGSEPTAFFRPDSLICVFAP